MTTTTVDQRLAEFDQDRRPRQSDPLDRAMTHLRQNYLDAASTAALPGIAGMKTDEFRRAFRLRFGKTPATVRAELQVNDIKTLLRQGVPLHSLVERLGFSSKQRMVNSFREVAFKCATKWLAEERKKDPTIPAQPGHPLRGRRPGTAKSPGTIEKIRTAVTASWAKRSTATPKRQTPPPPKGPQPVLSGAALAAAEIKRGAAAFDEYQRRMAAERLREATTAPPPAAPRETRPSRPRGDPTPINPQLIPAVDNTPTAATCFDRFVP
jgi:AraC-like DNA-binding protein